MSDQDVVAVLDRLEQLLEAPGGPQEALEPQAVAQWQETFDRALATAQRGPRWPEIRLRAKTLKARLDQRVDALRDAQRVIQGELEQGARGRRALAGYRR